jgi:hypothetical protein
MTNGRVTVAKLGGSTFDLRHRVLRANGEHPLRLMLAVWDTSCPVAKFRLPLGALPAFKQAVIAAVDEAIKAAGPSQSDGRQADETTCAATSAAEE